MSRHSEVSGVVDEHPGRWRSASDWRPPDATELDLWRVPLADLAVDLGLLGERERARLERLRIDAKREQFAAGQNALRRVLARYIDRPPADIQFSYGDHGKPYLAELAAGQTLGFNLSHSHELALIGVAPGAELGVDVEHARAERPFERLARRFFVPEEGEVVLSRPPAEWREAFYRTWTLKEAYLKAIGTGLSLPPRSFGLDLTSEPPRLAWTDMDGDDPERWSFVSLPRCDRAGDYVAAACCEGCRRRVHLWEM